MTCAGDSFEYCGGANRLNIYESQSVVTTTGSSTTPSSSTITSTSLCSPTQVIVNPSFEQDLDDDSSYLYPWVYGEDGYVKDDSEFAYDGTHFA